MILATYLLNHPAAPRVLETPEFFMILTAAVAATVMVVIARSRP